MSATQRFVACAACLVAAAALAAAETTECGGTLTDPEGYISYGSKTKLQAGIMCRWTIKVPGAISINLTLDIMFLSRSGKGCNQMLVVASGDGDKENLVENPGRFPYQICGKRRDLPPAPVQVDGDTAVIYLFTLKPGAEGRGFALTYEANFPSVPECAQPTNSNLGMAACEGDWTIVQRREIGDIQFNQSWESYKWGFGDVSNNGDYWLGNEALHELCPPLNPCQLRFELGYGGEPKEIPLKASGIYISEFSSFSVYAETHTKPYMLNVEGYKSDVSDTDNFDRHNGYAFSTKDRDNDGAKWYSCSANRGDVGWWFTYCGPTSLNGLWGSETQGLLWWDVANNLGSTRMMIKAR